MAGRPKIIIDNELLATYIEFNFTQEEIASFLGISLRTCKSKIKELNLQNKDLTSSISGKC